MSFQLRTLVLGCNGQYFTIAHVDLNVLSVNFEKSKWSVKCPADFGNQVLTKNLGRLWLAYTELQDDFYVLQFISVDSRHFTQT